MSQAIVLNRPPMRRRTILSGLGGLALAPTLSNAQSLGDACRPDQAEGQGAFVATFGDPAPKLWFVATRHSMDLGSQTFQTVAAAIDRAGPSLVIVEGLDTAAGENPGVEVLRDLSEAAFRGGEARYAAMFAAKHGIAYLGGEVSARVVNDVLLRTYSLRDIIQAYLTRDIGGHARMKPFTGEAEFQAFVRQAANRLARTDSRLWDPALAEGTWYLKAHPLADRLTDPDIGTPCGEDDASRIIAKITEIRNLRLYDLIASRTRAAAPVLVVYGSGHLRALRAPLERLLGPAHPWSVPRPA